MDTEAIVGGSSVQPKPPEEEPISPRQIEKRRKLLAEYFRERGVTIAEESDGNS